MKSFKSKSLQEKGITLIALIITVIILLILAGASIVAIKNIGLFDKTRQATELYKQRVSEENEILEGYGRTLNVYLEGRTVVTTTEEQPIVNNMSSAQSFIFSKSDLNASSTKVGKTINYTPQALSDSTFTLPTYPGIEYRPDGTNAMSATNTGRTEALTWKVLSEDTNGNLLITTTTPTTAVVHLGASTSGSTDDTERILAASAYDNSIQALDAYCYKYFSNETEGIEARNLKIEDVESHETSAGTTAREGFHSGNYNTSANTKTYYPSIYSLEANASKGQSESPTNTKYAPWLGDAYKNDGDTVYSSGYMNTYYYFSNEEVTSNNYYDANTLNLFFTTDGCGLGFWVSSRRIYGHVGSYARFSVIRFPGTYCYVGDWEMLRSNGYYTGGLQAFRPVVSIPASKVANYTLS